MTDNSSQPSLLDSALAPSNPSGNTGRQAEQQVQQAAQEVQQQVAPQAQVVTQEETQGQAARADREVQQEQSELDSLVSATDDPNLTEEWRIRRQDVEQTRRQARTSRQRPARPS